MYRFICRYRGTEPGTITPSRSWLSSAKAGRSWSRSGTDHHPHPMQSLALAGSIAMGISMPLLGAITITGTGFSNSNTASADGSTFAGFGGELYRDGVVTTIANGFGGSSSTTIIFGLSNDGTVAAGMAQDPSVGNSFRAFSWSSSGGWVSLAPGTAGFAVSGDGNVVVGQEVNRAVKWVGGALVTLPSFTSGQTSSAAAASFDGSVIAGIEDTGVGYNKRALRWTSSGVQDLGSLGGTVFVEGISGDGAVVVGQAANADGSQQTAFRWSEDGGMANLGTLGGSYSQANATNGDGSVVAGYSEDSSGNYVAFVWTATLGMVSLWEYLDSLDVDLTGWVLDDVYSISADASTISGFGSFNGNYQAWVVSGLNFNPSVIPGGGAAAMLAAGLGGLTARRRR